MRAMKKTLLSSLLVASVIISGCQGIRSYENFDLSSLDTVQKYEAISYLAEVTRRYARDIYNDKVCTFTTDKMKLYGASLAYNKVRVDNYFAGENANYISSYGIDGKGDCTIAKSEGAPLPEQLTTQIYAALKSLGVRVIRVQTNR